VKAYFINQREELSEFKIHRKEVGAYSYAKIYPEVVKVRFSLPTI
jgi:hypothetical protein